jgi:RNA polymerase primary sigma factor
VKDSSPRRPRPARSPFDSYLTEIDRTPLLTAQDEIALARRVADGDLAARDRMVRANLRLVVSLARHYAGKGLPLEDLVAEGNMGLVRAVEGYDPAAGTRFSTYARYWVKQSIRRALSRTGNAVRLPQYVTTLLAKWAKASAALYRELGRTPTDEEVAARLGLSDRQLRVVRKARRVYASGQPPEGPDGDPAVGLFADARELPPDDRLAGAEEVRKALDSVGRLEEREAQVLRLRFGLDGGEPASLQEVGERLGYTRERIRQIERDALAKLREHLAAA